MHESLLSQVFDHFSDHPSHYVTVGTFNQTDSCRSHIVHEASSLYSKGVHGGFLKTC